MTYAITWAEFPAAPELVGEDGTAGRYGSRHHLDKDVDAAVSSTGSQHVSMNVHCP